MKNLWIEFFGGIITVKISGKGIERFINTLIRNGIHIWDVKRHGTQAATFKMKLGNVSKLRKLARKSACKITFLTRDGMPFLLKRLSRNLGFVIGAASFFIILTLLSNMVWGIEIKGAHPATEYKIRQELKEMGIQKGKLQFFIDNDEAIQRMLSNNIQEITWVGVELKGTTYQLQVVEKNEPKKPEHLSPRHLVAKKKAVIVDMFVEEGQPVVNIHDHVEKGQLLVSGTIGSEEKAKTVSAKGKVLGETWYKTKVELPLKSTFQVLNGNEKRKHYINIGSLQIPIWGFGKVEYTEYEKETNEKKVNFLKWQLPISYSEVTFREREKMNRIYSNEEAIEVAKEMARSDIKSRFTENAKIKGEKVLHQSVENGKVILIIHFQIIENIAKGQPIIQGDTE